MLSLQKNKSMSLFVSLDLSSDKTEEVLKNLSSKNHNLFILRCGERFGSAAKNFFRLINEVNVEKTVAEEQTTNSQIKISTEIAIGFQPPGELCVRQELSKTCIGK